MNDLKCFVVMHDGYWHSGSTIVFATDEQAALDMVSSFLLDYYKKPTEIDGIVELTMVGCHMIDDGNE
jgi:hypothetical protein